MTVAPDVHDRWVAVLDNEDEIKRVNELDVLTHQDARESQTRILRRRRARGGEH